MPDLSGWPCSTVVEAAAASFKAGLLDTLLKKKSRLHRTALEELAAMAPSVAVPVLPEVLQVWCHQAAVCGWQVLHAKP